MLSRYSNYACWLELVLNAGAYANLVQLQTRNGSGAGAIPSLSTTPAVEHISPEQGGTLDEQDSCHTAQSAWTSSTNTAVSSANGSKGWLSRLGRLRRRSSSSATSSGGGSKDVEGAYPSPRSTQHRIALAAAAAAGKSVPVLSPAKPKAQPAFWRLLRLVRSETLSLAVGALACMGHGSMMPAFASLLTSILAIFQLSSSAEMLQQASMYAVSLAAVGIGACCCVTVQFYTFGAVGTKLARRLRVLLLEAILRQEIG